jgi:hypothetical protein
VIRERCLCLPQAGHVSELMGMLVVIRFGWLGLQQESVRELIQLESVLRQVSTTRDDFCRLARSCDRPCLLYSVCSLSSSPKVFSSLKQSS